jgi:cytochrome c oxidase assembly protein subunit 15
MASRFKIYALFRREAPKLGREFRTCCSQRHNVIQSQGLLGPLKLVQKPTTSRSLMLSSTRASLLRLDFSTGKRNPSRLLSILRGTEQRPHFDQGCDGGTTGQPFFPKVSSKVVAYWLLGSAASIFGIVVFGGLTRLTESGCVITLTSLWKLLIL